MPRRGRAAVGWRARQRPGAGRRNARARRAAGAHVRSAATALTDAVDDGLAAFAVGDLHHALDDVDRRVVLKALARHLVEHDQLVAARLLGDGPLALCARADHLVAAQPRHLRGPLAGAAAHAVDQAPLTRLDQVRVRVVREVVRGEALDDARGRHVEPHAGRHLEQLGGGHGGVLGVGLQDRVGHAVTHLPARRLRLGRERRDLAAALLAADERQLALVHARAVVRVDEVDAGELVLDEDLRRVGGRGARARARGRG